ncbi:hypothetical protein ASG87_18625 [Frateuria sp. Soil773]|uniref:capsule biosynthesis GfcC family protein n=1 Tax=Frateuria sp. Soil773 TaxID=1736407 RepID=UPI0006F305E4|nr:capsule biosynthesis GfcC family protein [Frateuria sp. Soil773]KRE91166.1 hypothetical protein ASG87_18625 [Frateuria sp. Soil773]
MNGKYLIILASLLGLGAPLHATQVEVGGAVNAPATLTLKEGARLSNAALAVPLQPRAYLRGAAWLRPGLIEAQQRLKAGVLFDLASLQRWAAGHDKPALHARAAALADWIKAMPVTGRQPALLDPRVVEATPAENRPLAEGDRLYYPLRPGTIQVVGAVQQHCTLPLVPLQDARRYLASCPLESEADPDTLYVIQPDGRVFEQGYALWNRSPPLSLAPGAVVYVPLRAGWVQAIDPDMNRDLADFLATQLLPGPEETP